MFRAVLLPIGLFLAVGACSGGDNTPSPTAQPPSPSSLPTSRPGTLARADNIFVSVRVASFANENSGWIATDTPGYWLIATSDGGAHWRATHSFESSVKAIDFVSDTTGFALTYDGLFRTSDGGDSWSPLDPAVTSASTGRQAIFVSDAMSLDFVDQSNGWLDSLDALYKTTDGGATWTTASVPCGPHPEKGFTYVDAMSFIDDSTGWLVCPSYDSTVKGSFLYSTTDAGATWTKMPPTSFHISTMSFLDAHAGFAGSTGAIYATEDGGATWRLASRAPTEDSVWVAATPGAIYASAQFGGALEISTDNAATWRILYAPPLQAAPTCTVDQLSASIVWSRAADPGPGTTSNQYPYTGNVEAVATLQNAGQSPCTLTSDHPAGQLLDADGQIIVADMSTPAPGSNFQKFVLLSGEKAAANIRWNEWCNTTIPATPLKLEVDLPNVSSFTFDVLSADGTPISPPYCHFTASPGPSYLHVNGFGPLSPPVNPD